MTEHMSPIPSRVYNAAVGGHVCGPEDVDFGQKVVHLVKYDKSGNEVSFESQVTQANKIYVIHDDFVLSSNVTIPANCVLQFDGGSVSGPYKLIGQDTIIYGQFNVNKFSGSFYDTNGLIFAKFNNSIYSVIKTQADFDNICNSSEQNKNYWLVKKTFEIKSSWNVPKGTIIDGEKGCAITSNKSNCTYSTQDAIEYNNKRYVCPLINPIINLPVFINAENDEYAYLSKIEETFTNGSAITYENGVLKINHPGLTAYCGPKTFGIMNVGWLKVPFTVDNTDGTYLYCTPLCDFPGNNPIYSINMGINQDVILYNVLYEDGIYYNGNYIYIPNKYHSIYVIDGNDAISTLLMINEKCSIRNITFKNSIHAINGWYAYDAATQCDIENCTFKNLSSALSFYPSQGRTPIANIRNNLFLNCLQNYAFSGNTISRDGDSISLISTGYIPTSGNFFNFTNNKVINTEFYYPSDRFTLCLSSNGKIKNNEFVNIPYAIRLNKGNIEFNSNKIYFTEEYFNEYINLPFDGGALYCGQIYNYSDETAQNYPYTVTISKNSIYGFKNGIAQRYNGIYADDGRGHLDIMRNKVLGNFKKALSSRDITDSGYNFTKSSIKNHVIANIFESPILLEKGSGLVSSDCPSFYGNLLLRTDKSVIGTDIAKDESQFVDKYCIKEDSVYLDSDFIGSLSGVFGNQIRKIPISVDGLSIVKERDDFDLGKPLGFCIFDKNLKKPVWWDGTQWVDATGNPV